MGRYTYVWAGRVGKSDFEITVSKREQEFIISEWKWTVRWGWHLTQVGNPNIDRPLSEYTDYDYQNMVIEALGGSV